MLFIFVYNVDSGVTEIPVFTPLEFTWKKKGARLTNGSPDCIYVEYVLSSSLLRANGLVKISYH